jgi:hypothetical protein
MGGGMHFATISGILGDCVTSGMYVMRKVTRSLRIGLIVTIRMRTLVE